MSIAAGRMWSQLGTSIDQIGRMALLRDQQRKEEDRQREQDLLAEQDRRLALDDRSLRLAQMGIQFVPAGQPAPNVGIKAQPASPLPMAIPMRPAASTMSAPAQDVQAERMGLPPAARTAIVPTAPSLKASLSALGKAVQPRRPGSEIGAVLRSTPEGQYVRTGMSAADEEDAATRSAAKVARAARETAAATNANLDAAEARAHLAAPYWGARPKNLGVEATNVIGRQLAGQRASGGGPSTRPVTPTGRLTPAAAQERLKVWRPQYADVQQDLSAARVNLGRMPGLEDRLSVAPTAVDSATARRGFSADSSIAYGAVNNLVAQRDSLGNLINQASRDAVSVPPSYLLPMTPDAAGTRTPPPVVPTRAAAPAAPAVRPVPARPGFDLGARGRGRGPAPQKTAISQEDWDDLVEMYPSRVEEMMQLYTITGRP